jgi:predicted amidohydrolase
MAVVLTPTKGTEVKLLLPDAFQYELIYSVCAFYSMQKLAKELGVVIPVSFFEEANNAHYNSIAMIDADGADLGLYRKSHIPDGPGI